MIAGETRFAARPDVLLTGTADAPYLTSLDSGAVVQLNEVAARIFEAAKRGDPVAAIEDALAGAYPDVPRDEIARDVRDALADFVRRGLLDVSR